MIYKGYRAEISYSEEDELFFGRVINIEHDIIAFDGRSIDELKQAFAAVVDEYLQDCLVSHKQAEQPSERIAA
jgi:predicted HicB family RNase H-like nuclease